MRSHGEAEECICCRDGGLGWASEVRQVLSYGTSAPEVLVKSPMALTGTDPRHEGLELGVSQDLLWLEVDEVGKVCSHCVSGVVMTVVSQHEKWCPGRKGFVCGSSESQQASERAEEEHCPECYSILNQFCWEL